MWQKIEQLITKNIKKDFKIIDKRTVNGGCINQTWEISGKDCRYFIKTNHINLKHMFLAEKKGLEVLAKHQGIRVPEVIAVGEHSGRSYIILEYINFNKFSCNDELFGEQLALMHKNTSTNFGFDINNTIGTTPQINQWCEDWVNFFAKHRLTYQLTLAKSKAPSKALYDNGMLLVESIKSFFKYYHPKPSLLHGDLWCGNYSFDDNNQPVIFDPATYYGDREVDLAMTELFGGFNHTFYQAYNNSWALDVDYKTRKHLYNLYHILNHFNLFGGSYEAQSRDIIYKLLAEVR